jgi:hypothetical protein
VSLSIKDLYINPKILFASAAQNMTTTSLTVAAIAAVDGIVAIIA